MPVSCPIKVVVKRDRPVKLTVKRETPIVVKTLRQGPPGVAAASYTHTQTVAATMWTVNHNLGFKPSIEILDNGGNELVAQVLHTTNNQALIYFNVATAGSARCN